MLAVSIKNSILILLIVLILHFLLKNTLMEKQRPSEKKQDKKETFEAVNEPMPAPPVTASVPAPVVSVAEKKECAKLEPVERNTEDERAELLKYVFGEDATKMDDNELGQYFQGMDVSSGSKTQGDPCPLPRTDAHSLPITTTCDSSVLTLALEKDKKKPSSKCVKQDSSNGMVLHEYDDENGMNGGLFGGLNAFDGFSTSFQDFAPCN